MYLLCRTLLVYFFLISLIGTPVSASEAQLLSVSQVLYGGGASYEITEVPYLDYWDLFTAPGREVMLTLAPNSIILDGQAENRNVGHLLGLALCFEDAPDTEPLGLFGDTLAVVLDVASMNECATDVDVPPAGRRTIRRYKPERAVPQVVECLKRNAARRWPRVRFLRLSICGSATFSQLAGTHPLDAYAPLAK